MSHVNKKHKTEIINKGINHNNNRIIVLPIIIQKYILKLLYKSIEYTIDNHFGYNKHQGRKKTKFSSYALVNWVWYKVCQSLESNLYQFDFSKIINTNNQYKFMNKHTIKHLVIDFMDISSSMVNEINSYNSLESIVVSNNSSDSNETWIGNSVWILTHLNKLNDNIIVNFDLSLYGQDEYNESDDAKSNYTQKETFSFKAGYFNVLYDYEINATHGFLYDIIKDLQFKSLYYYSGSVTDSGASHLNQYHSISKLNQHYESVEIRDYIPLYALYRFLKAPKLQTLVFRLQFHFLSSIYKNGENSIPDNSMVNFEEMDNFQFRDSKKLDESYKVHNMKYYIENGINEDNQVYCSYSRLYNQHTRIPPYSKLLLKECLGLLKNNTTITTLKITDERCEGCNGERNSPLSEHFLNDIFDALSKNKTIKHLTIQFGSYKLYTLNYQQKESLQSKIIMMLDQNTTLDYLCVDSRCVDKDKISEKTTNKKCKL